MVVSKGVRWCTWWTATGRKF